MAARDAANPSGKPAVKCCALMVWGQRTQLAVVFLIGIGVGLLITPAYQSIAGHSQSGFALQRADAYRVDLNNATRAELLQLPGVGPALAERIEDYQLEQGTFRQSAELMHVPGVGPKTWRRLQPYVEVSHLNSADHATHPLEKRSAVVGKATGHKANGSSGPVDINEADETELQQLPGIGPKMAARVVLERNRRPFRSIEELRRVKGVGPKTLERLRPFIKVNHLPPAMAGGLADK